jgi:hypothetical protein
MTYGWSDRATKAESRSHIGGDNPATIFKIGQYEVTIPGANVEGVTYRLPYHRNTDPRQTLPNMEIAGGEIRIPIPDIVAEVLTRLEPRELAEQLWSNAEVRAAFCEKVVSDWEQDFTDSERRQLIRDLKESVHSKALDRLANKISSLEYSMSKRAFFYHESNAINDRLYEVERELRGRLGDESITLPRYRHEDNDPDFKIGGKHWNDARDDWRDEVRKLFPGPEADLEDAPEGGAI